MLETWMRLGCTCTRRAVDCLLILCMPLICCYSYGIVLKELRDPAGARQMLCQSVSAYPLNWSAWLDLASLCTNKETVRCSLLRCPRLFSVILVAIGHFVILWAFPLWMHPPNTSL